MWYDRAVTVDYLEVLKCDHVYSCVQEAEELMHRYSGHSGMSTEADTGVRWPQTKGRQRQGRDFYLQPPKKAQLCRCLSSSLLVLILEIWPLQLFRFF